LTDWKLFVRKTMEVMDRRATAGTFAMSTVACSAMWAQCARPSRKFTLTRRFSEGAAYPTPNSWQHVFYSAVLENPEFLEFLTNGELPPYLYNTSLSVSLTGQPAIQAARRRCANEP